MADVNERISVVNTLPLPVEVVVVSKAKGREGIEARFGVPAGATESTTVLVTEGGSFEVTANWEFEGENRASNTFTANLLAGYPITPVTLTLGMSFSTPTSGQWKGVDWEPPPDME